MTRLTHKDPSLTNKDVKDDNEIRVSGGGCIAIVAVYDDNYVVVVVVVVLFNLFCFFQFCLLVCSCLHLFVVSFWLFLFLFLLRFCAEFDKKE